MKKFRRERDQAMRKEEQISFRKIEERINSCNYKESGPEEKIQEAQEREKVEIGPETVGESRQVITTVLYLGGLHVVHLWSPPGGRAVPNINQ